MSFTLILTLVNLATIVLTILTIMNSARLWKMRPIFWLLALSISFLISSFCLVNFYSIQSFEEKLLFFYLRVSGMTFVAPCWLYFISSVFERWTWLHKKWVMGIMFTPSIINCLMLLSPATRSLLFYDFQPIYYLTVNSIKYGLGSGYKTIYAIAMSQMLMSYIISAITFIKSDGTRKKQVLILNIGLTTSLVQSYISFMFADIQMVQWVVGDTFLLISTQIALMYALLRHRLLNIIPLAMVRIFEQLPDPVFVLDSEQRIMGVSEKGIKIFNLSKDFLGRKFVELIPHIPLVPGEIRFAGHDFHLALESIGSGGEQSSGTVVFFRDIGAQKKVELRLQEDIEFRARLLALLAHDLSGFVDSHSLIAQALQKSIGPGHHEHFELLENSSMASQNLIRNVMDWIQNQPSDFLPVKKSFEWNSLIREILEQLQGRLQLKGVEAVFSSSSQIILGEGDSEMMSSVIRNVIFNSLRATSHGKKIYVKLAVVTNQVEISIRDEGHGLEASELSRIIESSKEFVLAGVTKTHGSGIGLMIARHFISLHQGSFSMNSQRGVGTEVLISIPL